MIFVDSNIPMYLIGVEHPNKWESARIGRQLADEEKKLVTNTEVLQEILHRYTAIRRKQDIQLALDSLYSMIDEVLIITEADVLAAKEMLLSYEGLSSRDAVHAANMKRLKIDTIFSFDRGFDLLPGLKRIPA